MPVIMPRSGFTLLDHRANKLLTRYHLTTADTFAFSDSLRERIAATLTPPTLKQMFADVQSNIDHNLARLGSELRKFDPTLESSLKKSQAKIAHQLSKLTEKTARENMRRDTRATADAAFLTGLLYPHRHLQERFYTILPFLAKHGLDLVDTIYDNVSLDCPDHKVLVV